MISEILKELKSKRNKEQSLVLARFFKTGKGDYGEGDIFWGIKVPTQRIISKKFKDASLEDVKMLINSEVHEIRLTGLFILIEKYEEALNKKKIFDFYLRNKKKINNWDLVDLSSPKIVGNYLLNNKEERIILYSLARSNNLWDRRIAIVSTFSLIKNNIFKETLDISKILLKDNHDLIHKSVGWMLREVGKRDKEAEKIFLNKYYRLMPRTMLRYSIEKFPIKEKEFYMKK
jgi:3-methyladenine DNA glycosylase AlkD